MQKQISPTIKGLITAGLMLATALGIYLAKLSPDSPLQYIVYILYAVGITWTLVSYRQSETYTGKFGDLFLQGFKCFIVVTLVMVIFTAVFSKMHPEFAEEASQHYKEQLIKEKDKSNKTPAEIDEEVAKVKNYYTTGLVYASIFGYLIIGTVVTAAVSGLILIRREQ